MLSSEMANPQPSTNRPGLIYLLTSPSKKQYVGQTVQTFRDRMREHESASRIKIDEGCRALNNAIRLYGWDNFTKEIILYCNESELDNYEEKFIEIHNTLAPGGYNLTTGGHGNKRYSEETKELIRHAAFARDTTVYRRTEDTKNLPKYMVKTAIGEKIGYKISKHPLCPAKYFASKSKTMEEKERECREFLDKLNMGEIPNKPEREFPRGIQQYGDNCRILYKKPDGSYYCKNFSSGKLTKQEKLDLALKDLARVKAELGIQD